MMLILLSLLCIHMHSVFAAPVNDLEKGETAAGIIGGNHSSIYYLETQNTDMLTVGIQYLDLKENNNATDFYAQLKINESLRAIAGNRAIGSASKYYMGAAVKNSLIPEVDGYAAVIAGSGFQELQLGASYKITDTNDINISFCTVTGNKSSIGIGLSCRF